jgi:hypothetical protein
VQSLLTLPILVVLVQEGPELGGCPPLAHPIPRVIH